MNKNNKIFLACLLLAFVWHLSVPGTKLTYDVLVAVGDSFVLTFLHKPF